MNSQTNSLSPPVIAYHGSGQEDRNVHGIQEKLGVSAI
jgi:hypothetical protein